MQIVHGGKLSRLHALLVCGKSFAIVWPVQFAKNLALSYTITLTIGIAMEELHIRGFHVHQEN